MVLDRKINEFYNFMENQNPSKRAFLVLVGPEFLAQLEEEYPKLMRIDEVLPEVSLYLYKDVLLLNEKDNEEIYEYSLNSANHLKKELRLQLAALLTNNKYFKTLIPRTKKINNLNILKEKFEENKESVYLWLKNKEDNTLLFNLSNFVYFIGLNATSLMQIRTNKDVQNLIERLNNHIKMQEGKDILMEMKNYLRQYHYGFLREALKNNEELKEKLKKKKFSRYLILNLFVDKEMFNKLIEELELLDEEGMIKIKYWREVGMVLVK
uniref:Uncharacterized protein n=2 Tax=Meloidogyne enterolobii TaxID=390850 RepID=A0A6V7XQA6_MELEN|nr:unnamed protein product [Meloidogyne enterolobii]